jgi:glycosyltransferase involved in cell wall biosynthesis
MKILQIIPTLSKGGAERLVLNICNELHKNSTHEIKLITFSSANEYEFLTNSIDWEIIPSKVIPSLRGKAIVEINELNRAIASFQPDVIHSHLFETEMILAHCSIPAKTKRIVHFHDNMHQFRNFSLQTLLNKKYFTDYFEKRIVLKSYKGETACICISEDTLNFASKSLPQNISKKFVHNAIDLERFHPSSASVESNEITIIGSLVDKKGHELALETIAELISRKINVHLNILGDGPTKTALENQLNTLGIQQQVTFHGKVDHPETFLQKSKLYLHTAKYEPFGLVLIEAMACGLPVVCTDGKGNRDLIREAENGFMVWERDPKLLADKIELLLKNDTLRLEIGEKARIFAQDFGIENYVDQLLKIYS